MGQIAIKNFKEFERWHTNLTHRTYIANTENTSLPKYREIRLQRTLL